MLWCPEQLSSLQRNQVPVSRPERWHKSYNHCYHHHSRCYHDACLSGGSSRVKQGLASAFCFWFGNVKMWRAVSIYREAEAPVGKLERMTSSSVLEHQQAGLNLKMIQSEQCSLQGCICISMGISYSQTNTEPGGWHPRANRHYNKAVLWLMLSSGVSPAITGAQDHSVIHCVQAFNMVQPNLNSSLYFLPAIMLGFSHAECIIPCM